MKYIICGNYGAGNIGDELILEGMINLLKQINSDNEIVVMSGNPGKTEQKHGVKAISKFPSGIRSLIRSLFKKNQDSKFISNADYFILGGGGLFGGPEYKANVIWLIQALVAVLKKKRLLMIGQSVGEIKGVMKYFVKYIFNKSEIIITREQDSARNLKKLGVNQEISNFPDLAFNIENPKVTTEKKTLIVSLRKQTINQNNLIENISQFLNEIIEKEKYKIKFIDFQKGKHQDNQVHKSVIDKISQKENVEHLKDLTTNQMQNEFSKAKMILGMRLHSIITAINCHKPFIGISYHQKVIAILKEYELEYLMLKISQVSMEELSKKFNHICKNEERIIGDLKQTTNMIKKSLDSLRTYLTKMPL